LHYFFEKLINHSKPTLNKLWSKSCVCQHTAKIICKCTKRSPWTTWMCRQRTI